MLPLVPSSATPNDKGDEDDAEDEDDEGDNKIGDEDGRSGLVKERR